MKRANTHTSWSINDWPSDRYPNSPTRARYLIRAHKRELMEAGAIARVGRELVIIGPRYERWLERQASRVPDYAIAPNAPHEHREALNA